VYAFDTRFPLQDGSYRATTWSSISPLAFTHTVNDKMYIGVKDGIGEYKSYTDNTASYQLSYFSHPLSFGNTSNLKFLKKKQAYTLPQSNVGQYNISEFNTTAEYSSSISLINRQKINASGQGTVVAIGAETTIDGKPIAIQEINIQALMGRIV